MGKKYLDTKDSSLESSILGVWEQAAKKQEGLDDVDPKAVKKKFDDRKDKDIDNDGDIDSSDKYLHKKRKAISKAVGEARQLKDPKKEMMVSKGGKVEVIDKKDWNKFKKSGYVQAEEMDYPTAANFKIQSMKAALAKVWGVDEGRNPFAKNGDDEDDEDKVKGAKKKTDTGKKAAKVDVNPEIKEKKSP